MNIFILLINKYYNQGWCQWKSVPPVGHTWHLCWCKILIFVRKNLLQLEFFTVSLIFVVIFLWKNLDSPQNKGNYLSGAPCTWLGIKVVKIFMMSYELSQLVGHFMFSIEGKGGLRKAAWGSWVSVSFGTRDNLL